ncbi:peptidase family M49-domain-containing protein [Astrocystis sublimbata]|nr:peptidase family M49-domain-containing protein [Astrocystis sublimbata]
MRQVSPESPDIFDFIMELYGACNGEWETLLSRCNISLEALAAFLEYAATFLCNVGNYYGEGDQKFVPDLSAETLRRIADVSPETKARLEKIIDPLLAIPPYSLGYPDENTQSGYYISDRNNSITPEDRQKVSTIMHLKRIEPDNTRFRKIMRDGQPVLQILRASGRKKVLPLEDGIELHTGDHSQEVNLIVSSLMKAKLSARNENQRETFDRYEQFQDTGNMRALKKAQRCWVSDKSPTVEFILGFIESYRDPAGIRCEWEAMVGIADKVEAAKLRDSVAHSDEFIRQLPWAVEGVNNGKGPFEKDLFEPPDFTSVHALAVCGSTVFEAANLPNNERIRETVGFKNIVLANRLSVNHRPDAPCHWIDASQLDFYQQTSHIVRYVTTAIHELLGHGTGKLLSERLPGKPNFDNSCLPKSPLTGRPITSWYQPHQTWGSVFGKLAGTVEECRAILMSEYFMDNKSLLEIFGYTDDSEVTAEDLLYATYLNIGVDGLQALQYYNAENHAWGQVHSQAHFSILKRLLQDGHGVISITEVNLPQKSLAVHVDRAKILSHGKPAIGEYLTKLHTWRCTANFAACREYYEPLCKVKGIYEEWRKIVVAKPKRKWKFVQPNTFLSGNGDDLEVEVKVYEASNEGIIQSWAERGV